MNVLLVSTPTRLYRPNTLMPLGVMYLASYLRRGGHDVRVVDYAKDRDAGAVMSTIASFQPEIVGVSGIATSVRTIDCLTRIVKTLLRRRSGRSGWVVVGGHVTLGLQEHFLGGDSDSSACDFIVTGYGEEPLLQLANVVEGGGVPCRPSCPIPGVWYRSGGPVSSSPETEWYPGNLDDIPQPAYDLVDSEYYVTVNQRTPVLGEYLARTGKPDPPGRFAVVIAARGCTDRCTFCVHEFGYRGFFVHSLDYVRENVARLYYGYGVRIFGFGEDLFLYDARQAAEFCDMMNRYFPDAYFYCSTRADYIVRHDLPRILADSNCYNLKYGFESGSDEILGILNKRTTSEINIDAYRMTRRTPIVPSGSFMVGTPGETPSTIVQTVRAIKRATIMDTSCFCTTPYPGTRLFQDCVARGVIPDVEKHLDRIAGKDALDLTVNLTEYPNAAVKLMQVIVLNAVTVNKTVGWRRLAYKARQVLLIAVLHLLCLVKKRRKHE